MGVRMNRQVIRPTDHVRPKPHARVHADKAITPTSNTHTHAHTTCRQQRILPCYSHNRIYTAFDYIGVYYTKYFVEGCEILPHIRTFKFVWFSAQTRIITCYIVCKTTQNIQILSLILVEEDDARFFFLQLESMCKFIIYFFIDLFIFYLPQSTINHQNVLCLWDSCSVLRIFFVVQ